MLQRLFDIKLSLIAIFILLPFLLIVIVILSLTGENRVFFIQKRIGKNKKVFRLIKFATMLENSPYMKNGSLTIKDDPRILPFGKYLRKSKINELPQLINILLGDMSFVGPRPLTLDTFNAYSANGKKIIQTVKPGLTGIGSIIFRNEEEIILKKNNPIQYYNNVVAPFKEHLEIWFVKNQNFNIYILIIFITVLKVFFPNNQIIWFFLRYFWRSNQ